MSATDQDEVFPAGNPPAAARTGSALLLLGVFAFVFGVYVLVGARAPWLGALFLALAAAAATFTTSRLAVLSGRARTPWVAFAASGAAAVAAHAVLVLAPEAMVPVRLLLVASYASFMIGLAIRLHGREHLRYLEIGLDVALILVASAVIVFRWSPGVLEVLTGAGNDFAGRLAVLVSPVVALASLAFTVAPLPAAWRSRSWLALMGAALAFAVATIPLALHGVECCRDGNSLFLAAVAGWLLLTWAALDPDWNAPLSQSLGTQGSMRLRQLIGPGVTLVLTVALADAALRPPLLQQTAIAMAVLGVLLALRLTNLLHMTRRQWDDRRELAQSLALVEVSRALSGTTELRETLARVSELGCRLLQARCAAIELLTPDGRALVMEAAVGLPNSALGMRFPVDDSFTGLVVRSGLPRVTGDARNDPLIKQQSLDYLGRSPLAAVPLRAHGRVLGALSCVGDRPFDAADLELLGALADQAAVAIENARLFEQVRTLSMTDPLTGLANRRQLERELAREFAAARRGRHVVAVMFDLDDFKGFNDTFGHVAGDIVLRTFGEALAETTRAMNLAARFGGDEFVVLLADGDMPGAEVFIERVTSRFHRGLALAGLGPVSVAAGAAPYQIEMEEPMELVDAADRALYVSKGSRSSR